MTISVTTPPCTVCGNTSEVEVDPVAFSRWRRGALAQVAFPDLNADQRELLITGTHPQCWDTIFEGMEK